MNDDTQAVRMVLDQFRHGWESLDAEEVLACFEPSSATTVIGTDADEYWRGFDAFAAPFRAMTGAFQDPRYRWALEPRIEIAENTAWADGVLDTALVAGGKTVNAALRATWVLIRTSTGWTVVQAHFSVAPDAPVAGY